MMEWISTFSSCSHISLLFQYYLEDRYDLAAMEKFTRHIVNMMKAERLYETQGGPIILSQIENKYGPLEYELGALARAYMKWATQMAVGLETGVPWAMCKQDDATDPVAYLRVNG